MIYKSRFLVLCCLPFLILTGCVTYTNQEKLHVSNYDNKASARIYLDLGLLRLSQQKTDEAEHYLLKAYKLDQHSLATVEAIALLHQLKQNYRESAKWFNKGLGIDKTHSRLNYNYAILLLQRQNYARAIDAFFVAVKDKHYADKAEIWENIAYSYQKLGKMKSAQMMLNKAEQIKNNTKARF